MNSRLALLSLPLLSGVLLAQAPKLTIDDVVRAGGARGSGAGLLSPDGKFFAEDQRGQITLVPVGGGTPTVLTSSPGLKSELHWSHDGRFIAFISDGNVWSVATTAGSELRQLTHDPAGPGDPRGATDHQPEWNPNGRWILYQSGRKGFNELYVVSEDGKEEKLLAPLEIYKGGDVIANTAPGAGDAVSSDRFDPNPAWSPDGTRVSFTQRSREHFSGRLMVLPFDQKSGDAAGAATTLYTAKNDSGGAWAVNTAAWAPDSKTVTVVLQESGWDKLWQIPAKGGTPRLLTKGTGEDESPIYSPDGKWIVFQSNRDLPEERHLWIVPSAGGEPHRVTHLSGIEAAPQWTPESASLYFSHATSLRPPATYVANADGTGEPRVLQPLRPSLFEHLGITPEIIHFKGKDDLPLAGILYKPAEYKSGTRYPTVIWAHGGPEGQVLLSLAPWPLFLAQQGFVVLEVNFRGGTGFGEKFRNSNVEDSGGGEIDDIGAGVKYLVDAGLTDPKHVGIGGGSHGGTVVANAVVKLPDTFAAGIEMFGVVDRALFLQYTNRNSKIRWETKMGGTPEQKPAVYRKANVLPDVAKIKTPLLILHGEEDPQVPPQESIEFVAALKAAGKTYSYFTYPHEGHGFRQPEHQRDSYEKQLAFLKKYLKPGDKTE